MLQVTADDARVPEPHGTCKYRGLISGRCQEEPRNPGLDEHTLNRVQPLDCLDTHGPLASRRGQHDDDLQEGTCHGLRSRHRGGGCPRAGSPVPRTDCHQPLQGLDLPQRITTFDWRIARTQIDTNLTANYVFAARLLPQLLARGTGRFAVVSSLGSFAGCPYEHAYNASKAGARMMIDGLRAELLETAVRITGIYPGFVATDMIAGNAFDSSVAISAEEAGRLHVRTPGPFRSSMDQAATTHPLPDSPRVSHQWPRMVRGGCTNPALINTLEMVARDGVEPSTRGYFRAYLRRSGIEDCCNLPPGCHRYCVEGLGSWFGGPGNLWHQGNARNLCVPGRLQHPRCCRRIRNLELAGRAGLAAGACSRCSNAASSSNGSI